MDFRRPSFPLFYILRLFLCAVVVHGQQCPKEELDRCLKLADPFVQKPEFVFPTTPSEIKEMCRAWDSFTACIRDYVMRCLSEDRRQEFDRAVQESEDTMRQMCRDSQYQEVYLQNAKCIKDVSIEPRRCGDRYNKLLNQVLSQVQQDVLCCHFAKFRNCVFSLTNVDCGSGASDFAHHMIDKAMGFLLRSCQSRLQSESIDECPDGISGDNSLNIPGLKQDGAGQPTVLSPTPRTTVRWTYDPQNRNGNELGPAGQLYGTSGRSAASNAYRRPFGSLVMALTLIAFKLLT